jgi:hypothetical protein
MKKASCCGPKKEYHGKNLFKAISYALIPHIGCIVFILGAILGTTVLMQYFKPLLMSRNIFYYLILVSIGFATMSSFFYLKKNKCLCVSGIKKKKGYLGIMYGSTVGVNILLFFFIFPFLANFTGASVGDISDLELLKISVDIPCPGHAPLISSELSTIDGVEGVEYSFPSDFEIYYNGLTDVGEILSLEVFNEYPASILEDSSQPKQVVSSGSCSGGCGGAGTCGGSCGSPSCSYN